MLQATDKKMGAATGTTKADLARLAGEAPQLHSAMRDMLAIYRPELSFNPGVVLAADALFQHHNGSLKTGKRRGVRRVRSESDQRCSIQGEG